MFKDKKVLVAGGAGFVGTNLTKRLIDCGARVRVTRHNRDLQIHDAAIEVVNCDLTKSDDCARVTAGVDYVFMCAANTSGAGVMAKTPLVHVTPNIIMNTLLLDGAYQAGVKKFLWISSNTVYPALEHPVKEEEMVFGDVFEKYYCVAWMKQFSEVLCRMYAEKIKNPMKVVVLRPANIYGPFDDFAWETSHVLPALMRKVIERHDPVEVWGDGSDIKDLIFIDDFIDGALIAMEKIDCFDPINIATATAVSIRQALDIIVEVEGFKANIVFNKDKPTMISKRLIDTSKAEKLGFKAKTSLKDGIAKTIEWYRSRL
ncbi:MAG: NAD-dependent epimerase/dehydratase family protein [Candidatus Omnitrophica bacterium]|nr:NAD-dependent epimerase/dehydratase family protein [Candidatus Omnitrophota bacterium]